MPSYTPLKTNEGGGRVAASDPSASSAAVASSETTTTTTTASVASGGGGGGGGVRRRSSAANALSSSSLAFGLEEAVDVDDDDFEQHGLQQQRRRQSSKTYRKLRHQQQQHQLKSHASDDERSDSDGTSDRFDGGSAAAAEDGVVVGAGKSAGGAGRVAALIEATQLTEYARVLEKYPYFRYYLMSHLCQHMGDWFVRIASLLLVQELSSKGKALSHLVLSVKLPMAAFANVGGVLADRYDRRKLMIALDLISGVVVLGYLVAVRYQSLPLVYVVTILRSVVGAVYYPATTGIVPLIVPEKHDLQFAVTMNAWACTSRRITMLRVKSRRRFLIALVSQSRCLLF